MFIIGYERDAHKIVEKIDAAGGWPAWANQLAMRHGIGEEGRTGLWLLNGNMQDGRYAAPEWSTIILDKNMYDFIKNPTPQLTHNDTAKEISTFLMTGAHHSTDIGQGQIQQIIERSILAMRGRANYIAGMQAKIRRLAPWLT